MRSPTNKQMWWTSILWSWHLQIIGWCSYCGETHCGPLFLSEKSLSMFMLIALPHKAACVRGLGGGVRQTVSAFQFLGHGSIVVLGFSEVLNTPNNLPRVSRTSLLTHLIWHSSPISVIAGHSTHWNTTSSQSFAANCPSSPCLLFSL